MFSLEHKLLLEIKLIIFPQPRKKEEAFGIFKIYIPSGTHKKAYRFFKITKEPINMRLNVKIRSNGISNSCSTVQLLDIFIKIQLYVIS